MLTIEQRTQVGVWAVGLHMEAMRAINRGETDPDKLRALFVAAVTAAELAGRVSAGDVPSVEEVPDDLAVLLGAVSADFAREAECRVPARERAAQRWLGQRRS
jgi:hypothetical protein